METRIKVGDGKYTVIHEDGTDLHALRYGESWRHMVGDGLILAMAQDIEEYTDAIKTMKAALEDQEQTIEGLEEMRPHWAQGYSSDGIAAQCSAGALNEIWKLLGVDNQTQAMQKLKELGVANGIF